MTEKRAKKGSQLLPGNPPCDCKLRFIISFPGTPLTIASCASSPHSREPPLQLQAASCVLDCLAGLLCFLLALIRTGAPAYRALNIAAEMKA